MRAPRAGGEQRQRMPLVTVRCAIAERRPTARSPRGSLRRRASGEGGAERARTRRPRRGSGGARGTTHRALPLSASRRWPADAWMPCARRRGSAARRRRPRGRKRQGERTGCGRRARAGCGQARVIAAEGDSRAASPPNRRRIGGRRELSTRRARPMSASARRGAGARARRGAPICAAAASAAERLRETTRDGADGKAALKQARRRSARRRSRHSPPLRAGEAHRRLRAAEDTVARLEARAGDAARRRRPRSAPERALQRARRRRRARRRLRRRSREELPPMKRAAAEAVANARGQRRRAASGGDGGAPRRGRSRGGEVARGARREQGQRRVPSMRTTLLRSRPGERITNVCTPRRWRARRRRRGAETRSAKNSPPRSAPPPPPRRASRAPSPTRAAAALLLRGRRRRLWNQNTFVRNALFRKRRRRQARENSSRKESHGKRDAERGAAHPEDPEDRRDPLQTRYASVTPRARSRASLRARRAAPRDRRVRGGHAEPRDGAPPRARSRWACVRRRSRPSGNDEKILRKARRGAAV